MLPWIRSSPRPTRGQLLAGVPVRNPVVREAVRGSRSELLRLSAPLRPSRLREMLGARPSEKSFELDELGTFVWRALDGKRTVEALIRHFAAEKQVSIRESEVVVLAFLRTLAERNLIALALKKQIHA
ncbi:MAG TPA: PqqD family protein [Phycisphaerae bacterium]|jgi:hypothetical protein|nr:PqqD family protein [Phycisphaerae bacterium]